MPPAVRWLLVAVLAVVVASPPALLHALPTHDSDVSATTLAERIKASAGLGWSGEVQSQGALEVPLSGSTFGGVARLFGEKTDLRVWWGDDEHWRVDRIRTSGEEDLVRDGDQTVQWTYESNTATFTRYSPIRLPGDADVIPAQLASRLLAGHHRDEVSRLPARRVAGRKAPGLRLVPDDPRTTIDRADVWADEETGLPLRVDVYADGDTHLPILTTELVAFDPSAPEPADTSYEIPGGAHLTRRAAFDEAAGANAFAPFTLPAVVDGLPRLGDPAHFGAVGVYGRGPTALIGIPLRSSVTDALHDQLAKSRDAEVSKQRVALQVGPLSVLLLVGRDGGLLVTGTVQPGTLEDAVHDIVLGMVRTR